MEEFESKNINENDEPLTNDVDESAVETALEGEIVEAAPKYDWKKEVREWVQAILIAVVVAFLLKSYVLTLAKVQGESMEPTLQNADRLYVNKIAYTPQKGDVVIFEPASDPGRPYIKRVIATAGDTLYIDFSTGDVYVNGEIIDEPYINEPTRLMGSYISLMMITENFSKEKPLVIEEGYFFAMGDNRNYSKDSREIGPIPVDELIGHAIFRFWPLNQLGTVDYDYEN
ncbi:MAG: signal peptidase I [Ruminococcaceae bacterium]|nr:signal peptidase I [Oscillospiraceae bacterium]